MIAKLKDTVWFWIHRHRRNRIVARLCRLFGNIHRAWEHPTYDVLINGERDLLQRAKLPPDPVVFDVGANVGDWTQMAKSILPGATIHSFEMNRRTAEILEQNCRGLADTHVHPIGLGEHNHTAEFHSYEGEQSVLSSLRANLYPDFNPVRREATIVTGDSFCREHGLTRIDFLKIDAEGADYDVLSGFSGMLASRAISVIQFEHEGGRYIRDFFELLTPHGYTIGKLYANYVDFREHDISMERFLGPNYIAVPTSEKTLIETLRKGW